MRKVQLKGTDIEVSRFVFGTASLFNVGAESTRSRLLSAAVDAGFSHFDTAPYYGFGVAERDLARVLKTHTHLTVTTKVGIYSPGGEDQSPAAVFLRKAAGRLFKPISRPAIDFSLARAKLALEGSLRRLGRDVIDIYTLHEPELVLLESDEWQLWLERLVTEGKIRTFGLAPTPEALSVFLEAKSGLTPFLQVRDSLERREADILGRYAKPMQITYGYVSAALQHGTNWSVPQILEAALRRNSEGAIVVSTTKAARLGQYARLSELVVNAS